MVSTWSLKKSALNCVELWWVPRHQLCVQYSFLYFGCVARVLSMSCHKWQLVTVPVSLKFCNIDSPTACFSFWWIQKSQAAKCLTARNGIMAPIQAMRIMVGIQWENCWLIRKAEISHRQADTKCPLSTQATLKSSQWNTKSATDDEFFTNNPIFGGKSQRFSASDQ